MSSTSGSPYNSDGGVRLPLGSSGSDDGKKEERVGAGGPETGIGDGSGDGELSSDAGFAVVDKKQVSMSILGPSKLHLSLARLPSTQSQPRTAQIRQP
jgi:hypothetical protein